VQNQLQNEQREALRLKELDAFKSRLYTNITHEFRTPLTVILGMAEELEVGSQEQGRIAKTLGLVKRNGQNLLRLVNQLLDLSKLEDKSFKLRLQFGDIVPFLRYVTESFQSYANSQNLSLRFVSTMEKLEMDFDPEQVQQVLTNLIGNAIKFTPSGGEISVGMRDEGLGMRGQGSGMRDEGSGMNPRRSSSLIPHPSSLIISVSDTGIGISAAELPHIFDRFYQVDGSTTQAGEGTGIGLAHTLELVKLMQGKIEVESELGKGTKFTIQLPVVHLPGTQPLTSPQPPDPLKREPKPLISAELGRVDISSDSTVSGSPFRGSGGSHEGNNLLVIEDNADVVVYLKSILSEKYHVSVAYNGRIGIEMALENVPDLIVSDVMMPEKDGYQVLDTLKNDQLTSHIPIILLTAKADAASKVAGLKRGADAYLSKPFDKKELLATLEMMLENRRRMVAFFASQMAVPSEGIAIEDAFIQKVRKIVAENFADENFALPQLCDQLNMSRSQLFRKMKALTDTSPSDFIRDFRMQQARTLLESRQFSVKEVAYKVGFKDISHFSKSFQEAFGVSPSLLAK
jgi:signal transduction histidine kinase/DNA-binding response OmpR family regulator